MLRPVRQVVRDTAIELVLFPRTALQWVEHPSIRTTGAVPSTRAATFLAAGGPGHGQGRLLLNKARLSVGAGNAQPLLVRCGHRARANDLVLSSADCGMIHFTRAVSSPPKVLIYDRNSSRLSKVHQRPTSSTLFEERPESWNKLFMFGYCSFTGVEARAELRSCRNT